MHHRHGALTHLKRDMFVFFMAQYSQSVDPASLLWAKESGRPGAVRGRASSLRVTGALSDTMHAPQR